MTSIESCQRPKGQRWFLSLPFVLYMDMFCVAGCRKQREKKQLLNQCDPGRCLLPELLTSKHTSGLGVCFMWPPHGAVSDLLSPRWNVIQ